MVSHITKITQASANGENQTINQKLKHGEGPGSNPGQGENY